MSEAKRDLEAFRWTSVNGAVWGLRAEEVSALTAAGFGRIPDDCVVVRRDDAEDAKWTADGYHFFLKGKIEKIDAQRTRDEADAARREILAEAVERCRGAYFAMKAAISDTRTGEGV